MGSSHSASGKPDGALISLDGAHLVSSFFLTFESPPRCMVYLPATGGVATGHRDSAVRRWSKEGALEATLVGHRGGLVKSLAVRACGGLVSCGGDHTVRVWEGDDCAAVLEGHTDLVWDAVVHPRDDNVVVSCSLDGTVRVWDVAAVVCTAVLEGQGGRFGVAVLTDGSIVTESAGTMRVWDVDGRCKAEANRPHASGCLDAGPDNTVVVGGRALVDMWAWDGEKLVRRWVTQLDAGTTHWVSGAGLLAVRCFRKVLMLDAAGTVVGTAEADDWSTSTAFGRRHVGMLSECGMLWVLRPFPVQRMQAIRVLVAAWGTHGGRPAGPDAADSPVSTLVRMLSLRRVCRVRGADVEDMPSEVVEPFGRAVVAFL